MSRLDELPPDQRAALSLLLRQHKSYAQVAAMLAISEPAVHDRAHAALVMLAPARALTPEQRTDIGDYMLHQQPIAERLRTRALLAASEPARAWAHELAAELAPIADAGLPDIPAAAPDAGQPLPAAGAGAAPRPPALQRVGELRSTPAATATGAGGGARAGAGGPFGSGQALGADATGAATASGGSMHSSRTAGAVLLAVLAAVVVLAVVLITGGGGSKKPSTTATTNTTAASSSGAEPKLDNEIPLFAPDKHSKSIGLVDVVSKGSQLAFLLEARNLPAAKGFYYAVWLYNSPHNFRGLTKSSAVGANHTLGGLAGLPSNAGDYHQILLTKETSPNPERPGPVILRGAFQLFAPATATKK
jgi:hypothetical protein